MLRRNDAELAFALACHIFNQRTRIPETVAPLFVECQRSQMHTFVLRVLRYYQNAVRRVSDLIESLLDPSLNKFFKSPPLWLCLSATLEEMLTFRFDTQATLVSSAAVETTEDSLPTTSIPKEENDEKEGRMEREDEQNSNVSVIEASVIQGVYFSYYMLFKY